MTSRMLVLCAVVTALAVVVPARAGALDSGVRGTVTVGPIAPVCMHDVPCSRPYATRVVIRSARTGRRVATIASNRHGRFRVRLRPGRYTVRAVGGRPLPRCEPATLRVRRHRFTPVALSCDTGIR